jgi:hypothetical protein
MGICPRPLDELAKMFYIGYIVSIKTGVQMNNKKKSKIWKLSDDELQSLLNESNSFSEVLIKLNMDPKTGNRKTLRLRLNASNFDFTLININRNKLKSQRASQNLKNIKIPTEKILVENSTYSGNRELKIRLISEGLKEYKCNICTLQNMWNNKPLSLQLDHINGINNDNRIENLRFLCPNCHSQTDTFSGRRQKKITKCIDCNKVINKKSTRCVRCANNLKNQIQRKFQVSKEELVNLIKQYPMTKVGEILGVSDNAVRKRCRLLDVDYKAIGR